MQTHTLDWLDYVFGPATIVSGTVRHLAADYPAEDLVAYTLGFGGVVASGLCAYTTGNKAESVTIFGSEGSASMSFFAPAPVIVRRGGTETIHDLPDPAHVHQPFIERVVAHFLGEGDNPCPPDAGRRTTAVVEAIYA
jgi:predicted dehydrogenase